MYYVVSQRRFLLERRVKACRNIRGWCLNERGENDSSESLLPGKIHPPSSGKKELKLILSLNKNNTEQYYYYFEANN
jgi:hypothetical protein